MFVTILNRKISTTLIAIVLTVLAFLLLVFFIVIFKVEDKTISIINFYEQPVTLTIRNTKYIVAPFDTKVLTINTSNTLEVLVTNSEDKQLQNLRIDGIARNAQLISIALNPSKGYCFFNSEVSTDSGGNIILKDKTDLNQAEQSYAVSDMNTSFADYAFPGNIQNVQDTKYTKPIKYVYPISCNLVDNDDNVMKTIAAFTDYNAQDQLKYLNDLRAKISKTDSVDGLNSAIPSKTDKYYVSEEKYILIYE